MAKTTTSTQGGLNSSSGSGGQVKGIHRQIEVQLSFTNALFPDDQFPVVQQDDDDETALNSNEGSLSTSRATPEAQMSDADVPTDEVEVLVEHMEMEEEEANVTRQLTREISVNPGTWFNLKPSLSMPAPMPVQKRRFAREISISPIQQSLQDDQENFYPTHPPPPTQTLRRLDSNGTIVLGEDNDIEDDPVAVLFCWVDKKRGC